MASQELKIRSPAATEVSRSERLREDIASMALVGLRLGEANDQSLGKGGLSGVTKDLCSVISWLLDNGQPNN